MNDQLKTYTTVGTRLTVTVMDKAVTAAASSNSVPDSEIREASVAMALAAALVALRKEDSATVSVSLTYPGRGRRLTGLCEKDGRVRVCADDVQSGVLKEGVIMEVTQRLPVRGDYTSVVAASDEESAVSEYFRVSQQTRAFCVIRHAADGHLCVVCERFPITEPSHKIYDEDADRLFSELSSLPHDSIENAFSRFDAYDETSETPLRFGCTCTARSVRAALAGLSPEEIDALKDENGTVEIRCKHCGKVFHTEV